MSAPVAVSAAQVEDLRTALVAGRVPDDPAEQVALIAELEKLKSALCAMQADAAVGLDEIRRKEHAAGGVPEARQGKGVAAEVALARKESPYRGQQLLGFAKVLTTEMPHARARLAAGDLSEWRAMLLARETACLSADHRSLVDEKLCADPTALAGSGTREAITRVKKLAYELDPAAVVRRARQAEADRCVTIRPAPDTMSFLTGLLPVAQGVAVHASLTRDADSLRARGDLRSRGQLMADLLVVRVTGVDLPDSPGGDQPPAVPVTINLTLSDVSLLAGGHAPAEVSAEGMAPEVVPAEVARVLVSRSLDSGLATRIRNLYLDPAGCLVAMTSRRRFFGEGLADYLGQRDLGICRTPYCDAPIRHADHVVAHDGGGATTGTNGQGLCVACNHAKATVGWSQTVVDEPGMRHTVETITPSGHRYRSEAPAPVGWREPRWVKTHPGVFTLVA